MQKISILAAPVVAALLTACGGGGDSSGEAEVNYTISLRAERVQLPINIQNTMAGQGVYSPFTTTLYVEAKKGGTPIPGGEEIFQCNVAGGLNSGALYYLDGDDEHTEEVDDGNGGKIKIPLAYRSVTLPGNSGGSSFHFHAGNTAGTARITCSVTDPRDNRLYSASVDITVGAATGKASSIQTIATYPVLGTQGNLNNIRTSTAIEAHVFDDANQSMPAPVNANLQVAIMSGGAAGGARLLVGSASGSVAQIRTIGGVGLFSLASGSSEGSILLEMTADRADNDVTNGIQYPITHLMSIPVTDGVSAAAPAEPLVIEATPPAATNGLPYSYAFSASGGVAPYTWTAQGGLPDGLILSSSGILSGTPAVRLTGTVNVAVRVMDSQGNSITDNFPLAVDATAPSDLVTNPLFIDIPNCSSNVNISCNLPASNNPREPAIPPALDPKYLYQYVLTVTGHGSGQETTWSLRQNPSWLSIEGDGILTIKYGDIHIPGLPKLENCKSEPFFITAKRDGATTTRKVELLVGNGAGICRP